MSDMSTSDSIVGFCESFLMPKKVRIKVHDDNIPKVQMTFTIIEEFEEFYKTYSLCNGFYTRRRSSVGDGYRRRRWLSGKGFIHLALHLSALTTAPAVKRRTYPSAVKDARQCLRIEDLSTRGAQGKCVCVVPSSNQCPRREPGWGPARFLSLASVLVRGFRLLGWLGSLGLLGLAVLLGFGLHVWTRESLHYMGSWASFWITQLGLGLHLRLGRLYSAGLLWVGAEFGSWAWRATWRLLLGDAGLAG
ncbi:hypothetical protein DM860_012311 [Cuscuta australis]|uniref:Uncharacterized protein n=1 Tax=Cuscuta australis TaxID=267555 RepID=A0A328DQH5_9ASTE|nr:hypothetical protein DM860_012311 [Cuscuta australis]